MINHLVNQSIKSSDASLPPEVAPKGMATADGSSPLPIHTLPPCPLQPMSPRSPLTHVLLYLIFPSSKWPSPPIGTLNTTLDTCPCNDGKYARNKEW